MRVGERDRERESVRERPREREDAKETFCKYTEERKKIDIESGRK